MTRTASAAGFDRSWSWDRMDGLAA